MSAKALEILTSVDGFAGLYTARKGAARMMALTLEAGGLALYSPIGAPDEAAIDAARALGGVQAIIAPSHFHHLGIPDWYTAFPDASLYAAAAAAPRLQTRLGLEMYIDLPALSASLSFLLPAGIKAGEIWIRAKGAKGVAWAVCDAFAGPSGRDAEPADTPKARGAFATMCIGDRTAYKTWALKQIDHDQPSVVLPAHGNAVAGPDLPNQLKLIVEGQ